MSVRWSQEDVERYLRRDQPDPLPVLTEAAWQAAVVRLAQASGYTLIYHTHDSRRSPSGFPDLILAHKNAHRERGWPIWAVELKTDVGQVTPAQQAWLDAMQGSRNVIAQIWRPRDLQEIVARLRG